MHMLCICQILSGRLLMVDVMDDAGTSSKLLLPAKPQLDHKLLSFSLACIQQYCTVHCQCHPVLAAHICPQGPLIA